MLARIPLYSPVVQFKIEVVSNFGTETGTGTGTRTGTGTGTIMINELYGVDIGLYVLLVWTRWSTL